MLVAFKKSSMLRNSKMPFCPETINSGEQTAAFAYHLSRTSVVRNSQGMYWLGTINDWERVLVN